jgi:hypothetical protein
MSTVTTFNSTKPTQSRVLTEEALSMMRGKYGMLDKTNTASTTNDYTCIVSLQPTTVETIVNNDNVGQVNSNNDQVTIVLKMLPESVTKATTIAVSINKLNSTPQEKNLPNNKQFIRVYSHLNKYVPNTGPTDKTKFNPLLHKEWIDHKTDNNLMHHVILNNEGINEKATSSIGDMISGFLELYPSRIWRWVMFKKFGETLYELETTNSYNEPLVTIDDGKAVNIC